MVGWVLGRVGVVCFYIRRYNICYCFFVCSLSSVLFSFPPTPTVITSLPQLLCRVPFL